jgi:diguanylate cyclase (GGDEF)-like protein
MESNHVGIIRTMPFRTRFLIVLGKTLTSLVVLVLAISHFTTTGYFPLLDRITTIREIGFSQFGLLVSVLVTGLAVGGLMFLFVDRFLLQRVAEVNGAVKEIKSTGDHSIRLNVVGKDELADLASSINDMLETVESKQADHRRQAETLRQASAIVTMSLDQKKAIEHILEQLERVVPYDSASVQLLRGCEIEIVGGRGWPDNTDVIGLRFPIPGDNPNTVVIQTRKPYILGDAPSTHAPFNEGPHSHIKSWLGVPLIAHDQVIGMLAIDKSQPGYFTEKHLELANAFADQVAISIENARLYSDIQQRIGELTALRATVADITAELDLPKLLQSILKRATKLLNATGGDLGLYEEANQRVMVVVSYKMGKVYNGTPLAIGEGAMGQVASTLAPVIIDDYQIWEGKSPKFSDVNWHAVVAVPLLIGKRLVGVIAVVDEDPERRFTLSDQNLLTMFAQQAAIAVENANLYEEAHRQAITDSLTGLYNRRGLFELGQREVKRVHRTGRVLSAIMLDIDHFKQVNDKFSHAVGDEVLKELANRFKVHLRESDLLGRYGGEEFAVLLPETDVVEAYRIAERLQVAISDTPVETRRGPVAISISLGITGAQNGATDLAVLLDRADSAMYQAKLFGRNRIAVI